MPRGGPEGPMQRGVFLAVGAVALSALGCASPKAYVVHLDLEARRMIETARTEPTPDARNVVKAATTIAFNPPDACRDTKAAGPGATEVSNILRLQCGVLMTELEAAASRAGFSVVSWQTLRGGSGRPIEYARENKVDLLFEVNDLSFDIPVQDLYSFTNVTYQQRKADGGPSSPLVLRDAMGVAKRCQEEFWRKADPALTVTIDVKMVTVADGRVRWTYRNTKAEEGSEKLRVTRTWIADPTDSGASLVGAGLGIAIAGGVFILVPAISPATTPDTQSVSSTLQKVGGVAIGLGAALALVGILIPKEYPDPDATICSGPALEDAPRNPRGDAPQGGSSVSFSEQRKLRGGEEEIRRKKLLGSVIQTFIDSVAGMRK